jgi:adenylylsulfate kinase
MSGVVVFITGRPSAGKSTFALWTRDALHDAGISACLLDGDAVRGCLVPPVGYTPPERANFYRTLGNLAALLARQGTIVLVPATANRREFREHARSLAPRFVEVFVDTPLDECARRDTKGLYAAARAGSAQGVPGFGDAYEPPENPDIVAHGGEDRRAVEELCAKLSAGVAGAAAG